MRVLLFLVAFVGLLWWQHPELFRRAAIATGIEQPSVTGKQALFFTFDRCGRPCDDALALLDERGVDYREVDLSSGAEAERMLDEVGGGKVVPLLVVDGARLEGYSRMAMVSFLAEHQGAAILAADERAAMAANFDKNGSPRVVLYGTAWCGYCKEARRWLADKGIDWTDRDIEREHDARADYDALGGGGTPLIYFGYRRIDGFNQKALASALDQ